MLLFCFGVCPSERSQMNILLYILSIRDRDVARRSGPGKYIHFVVPVVIGT